MGEYIEAKFDELKASGKMPSPKGVALAILRLVRKPEITIDEIANVVKTDPSLSGNIIKAANSERSFYSRPIASVQVAVQRLGISTVKGLALGFSLIDSYRKGRCQKFDYVQYWAEQLLRAIAVREIAIRSRIAPSEDIFSSALLGEIGRLAFASIYPEEYSHVLDRYAREDGEVPLGDLEQQFFYIEHDELTRYILRDWGLPDILVETQLRGVQNKDAKDSRQYQLAMTFEVAKDIARLGMADSKSGEFQLALDAKLTAAGLTEVGMDDLVENILSEWNEWSQTFGLDKVRISFDKMPLENHQDESIPTFMPAVEDEDDSRVTVLVVEDDAEMRDFVLMSLSTPDYQVFTAENGEDALARMVDVSPDIIISDWVMPELDGLGLCRVVRQSSEFNSVYFIVMTGDDTKEALIKAFNTGVDDYITKPFGQELLEARLRPGVRLAKMGKQAAQSKKKIEKLANELAIVNRKLSLSSLTDPLTKLPNRRYAMKRLEQEWSAAKRNQRPLTCMMLDIDYFKVINDTYGHGGGDLVLRNLSKIIKGLLRTHDVACRMGGEEFMIICPDTDREAAMIVAERVRQAVERTIFPFGDKTIHITLSIGLATTDGSNIDYDELLNTADKKLYEAKSSGRNLVL
ncbi:MAG: diguanylate cyclase [Gammaproteobacteria bacterium]|nr:diguanylate cyclase [Gammaproteobacteria bacterium]